MQMQPDFQALFAVSLYPYLLVDTDYVIIGANIATGQPAGSLLGKHIFDAFPSNPDDPESTNLEKVRAAIATGEPQTSELPRYAIPRETPAGAVFDVRYWNAVHTQAEHAAHGDAIAPDVFLLDIGLPDINGNELAQRFHAGPRTGRGMLLAIIGYGQDRDRRETLATGFDHHLVKPIDVGHLFALLAGVHPSGNRLA